MWFPPGPIPRSGNWARSLGNAGLVLAALLFVLTRGTNVRTFDFGLIYFTTALPFLGSGIIVSLVISETIDRVDRIYFFDFWARPQAASLLVLLLNTFGGPNTLIAVSVLFAAAAAIWFSLAGMRYGRIVSVFVGLTSRCSSSRIPNFISLRFVTPKVRNSTESSSPSGTASRA